MRIHLSIRRWFDRTYGNSYFSARVFRDGEEVLRIPFQYGYGSHPQNVACIEARKIGLIPDGRECYLGSACRELGFIYTEDDVNAKKRDAEEYGFTPPVMYKWNVEVTDTFAGEANYSWIRRYSFTAAPGAKQRDIIRKAKACADLSNVRGRTDGDGGDGYIFHPSGHCLVMFVSFAGHA